jgi:hypothetical protein
VAGEGRRGASPEFFGEGRERSTGKKRGRKRKNERKKILAH